MPATAVDHSCRTGSLGSTTEGKAAYATFGAPPRSIAGSHSQAEALCVRIFRHAKLHGWEANAAVTTRKVSSATRTSCFVEPASLWGDRRSRMACGSRAIPGDHPQQNRLINADWRVPRFTWDDLVNRPDAVIAAVNRAIR